MSRVVRMFHRRFLSCLLIITTLVERSIAAKSEIILDENIQLHSRRIIDDDNCDKQLALFTDALSNRELWAVKCES